MKKYDESLWNTSENYNRLHEEKVFSGSFFASLIDCWFKADSNNKAKLVQAFPEVFVPKEVRDRPKPPAKKHRYMYTFTNGGWNTEMATNVRSARKQARERWSDSNGLDINYSSFRRITHEEYESVIRQTA